MRTVRECPARWLVRLDALLLIAAALLWMCFGPFLAVLMIWGDVHAYAALAVLVLSAVVLLIERRMNRGAARAVCLALPPALAIWPIAHFGPMLAHFVGLL